MVIGLNSERGGSAALALGYKFLTQPGITERTVREISAAKGEPDWMLQRRLKSFRIFQGKPVPTWGPDLSGLDLGAITYFASLEGGEYRDWKDVPAEIKSQFEKLGIPEAERKFLSGSGAMVESQWVYKSVRKELEDAGVIFMSTDDAVRQHPELVKEHFMAKCVPPTDNKFAALHGAVWSGGAFVYIPEGVKVEMPLQLYFLMNYRGYGQFEHTLIIAEPHSQVSYLEACSAPRYNASSLHSAVVEIFVKEHARVKYTSIQNWSDSVYNCLSGDTKIYTPNRGIVALRDIRAGDEVFSADLSDMQLKERKVINKWNKGRQKVLRLRLSNGGEIKATAEHPLLSFDKEKKAMLWKKAAEMKIGDIAWAPKEIRPKRRVEFEFDAGDVNSYRHKTHPPFIDERMMWLFGLYLGDGNLQYSKRLQKHVGVVYSVPARESIHSTLVQTVEEEFDIRPTIRKDGVASTFSSVMFARFIEAFGLGGNAHSKRVPAWVYCVSKEYRLAFLAGLVDSDGHITKDGYCAQIISCNNGLLEDIRYLALSVGMGASSVIERDYPSVGDTILVKGVEARPSKSYLLKLSDVQAVKSYLMKPESRAKIKELHRRNKLVRANNYNMLRNGKVNLGELGVVAITSIEEAGDEEVFDIEVEELHNFVANGIIVKNCNTKRAVVDEGGLMEWVGGSLGAKVSMLYPCSVLRGRGARADHIVISIAKDGTVKDGGAKVIHAAPDTTSNVVAKSICMGSGLAGYRGLLRVNKGCANCRASVRCDALLLGPAARSATFPVMEINENKVAIAHEATVGRISEESLFYLMSRGLAENEAKALIVRGFVEPLLNALPLEYAVEFSKYIEMEIEGPGAVG